MDSAQFREFGKAAVDLIADYLDNVRDRSVLPDVEPGYLHGLIPDRLPDKGDKWEDVLADVEKTIMPGMTHWQSPRCHAYYPAASSYPSIIGEMLAAGFGNLGFSWITSPVCTELEVAMMNWLGKLLNLPEDFLFSEGGRGGGVIQGSASEATVIALLAAKGRTIRKICQNTINSNENDIRAKLVGYTSDQANSSVEKAGLVGSMPIRILPSNEKGELAADTLQEAVEVDIANGLIPCFVVAAFGSTGTCSIDDLESIGPVCNKFDIWLHVDAAYAGAALMLPEYKHLAAGLKYADSFDFNLHKWLLVNFDCSAMWVKDSSHLVQSLSVDRIYLKHQRQGQNPKAPDYMHWQIALGRRFRALKVWITLRVYGVDGLQAFLRKQIDLALQFSEKVKNDPRFELSVPPRMGLVCFRLKGEDDVTKMLYDRLMARRKIFTVIATAQNKLIIRFCINSQLTERKDIEFAWSEISEQAMIVLNNNEPMVNGKDHRITNGSDEKIDF
nr:PREDICTED: alpha-methyldopa hypersensitive protein-like [Bemisia tabaci]